MEQFGQPAPLCSAGSCSAHIYRCPLCFNFTLQSPCCMLKKKEDTLLCCQGPVACRMRWLQTVVGQFMWHGSVLVDTCIFPNLPLSSFSCPTSEPAGHNIFFPMQVSLNLASWSAIGVLNRKQNRIIQCWPDWHGHSFFKAQPMDCLVKMTNCSEKQCWGDTRIGIKASRSRLLWEALRLEV